jgi:hypothetical protein
MIWRYDEHSRTVFEAATGHAIARDVEPEHGKLLAAAPALSAATQEAVAYFVRAERLTLWPPGHPMHALIAAGLTAVGGEVRR